MVRQNFIDLAKGITIVCVVFFHASASADPTLYYFDYLVIPAHLLYSFIMPLFFIVSAVFLKRRFNKDNFSNIDFLKKITTSILLPFYTLSFLFFIINVIAPQSQGLPLSREMIKGVLYLQSKGELMPSGILWFLFVLFFFTLFTFIFVRVAKVNIYFLFILAILLKTAAPYFHKEIYYLALDKAAQYYIYYVAGYVLSEQIYKGHTISKTKSIIFFFFCWITSFYFTFIVKHDLIYTMLVTFGLTGICGSLFILGLSYKIIESFPPGVLSRFLEYCGTHSILIYVFHTPTLLITRKAFHYVNFSDSLWGFLLTVFAGIFFPLLYGRILSYHSATYKLLLGRTP